MKSGPVAFALWCCCLVGLCGLHRFYLRRPWTGLLYLLTFGLLGVGQVIDLFLIGGMVRNMILFGQLGAVAQANNSNVFTPVINVNIDQKSLRDAPSSSP